MPLVSAQFKKDVLKIYQFKKDNMPCGATMIYLSKIQLSIHTFVVEGKITLDYSQFYMLFWCGK
jgi:hypothetical protein